MIHAIPAMIPVAGQIMDEKYWGDKAVEVLRILRGNGVGAAALLLIGGGVSALTGFIDKAIQAYLHVNWGDAPEYTGWVLVALGILLLLLNVSLKFFDAKPAMPQDEALMRELRKLFPIGVVEWLKTDKFTKRWLFSYVGSITEVADGWTTAHKEFGDRRLNRRLNALKERCREFSRQEEDAFSEGPNLQYRTFRTDAERDTTTVVTELKAENLSEAAKLVARDFEWLEREAKRRLPNA